MDTKQCEDCKYWSPYEKLCEFNLQTQRCRGKADHDVCLSKEVGKHRRSNFAFDVPLEQRGL